MLKYYNIVRFYGFVNTDRSQKITGMKINISNNNKLLRIQYSFYFLF